MTGTQGAEYNCGKVERAWLTREGVAWKRRSPKPARSSGGEAEAQYAANAYDSACLLLAAIKDASTASKGYPSRRDVLAAVRDIRFRGIAYREPVRWDEKGDNLAAVTALNGVKTAASDRRNPADAECRADLTPTGSPTEPVSAALPGRFSQDHETIISGRRFARRTFRGGDDERNRLGRFRQNAANNKHLA
ncbi:hypothetical protein NKJ81_00630 [Mesorhizobium sp. M0018]|uniref:hypothetical protein n=1 Tax=unclassified Mesorhizobium TaxID=325217 RepID=UPI003338F76A